MKKYYKYKIYLNNNFNLKRFPLRFLKFQKAKWFKFKQYLKNKQYTKRPFYIKNTSFINNLKIFNNKYKIKRRKNTFRNILSTKRLLYIIFNKAINIKYWRQLQQIKKWKHLDYMLAFLIKPYFKVDVLLWNLDLFISTRAVKKAIKEKEIYLNNKILTKVTFLKKGDVLIIKSPYLNIKKNKTKYLSDKKILSFIELDYYTNTITITKDFSQLTANDMQIIIRNLFTITRWRVPI